MKNLSYKIQILNENRGNSSLKDYVALSAQSDPNFFRWLFDEEFDNDFDSSLSEEQKQVFEKWKQSL